MPERLMAGGLCVGDKADIMRRPSGFGLLGRGTKMPHIHSKTGRNLPSSQDPLLDKLRGPCLGQSSHSSPDSALFFPPCISLFNGKRSLAFLPRLCVRFVRGDHGREVIAEGPGVDVGPCHCGAPSRDGHERPFLNELGSRKDKERMSKNLYVGNLSFDTTTDDLRQAFEAYGTVTSASVIADRETGRSRGFGFVEMSSGAEQAVEALNGSELQGRTITVNEARPAHRRARCWRTAGRWRSPLVGANLRQCRTVPTSSRGP